MAHFAKILNGKVERVIVAEQDFIDAYIDQTPGKWIQCSYNTRAGVHWDPVTKEASADQSKMLRYNFPSKGWYYNIAWDAFYPPQPYPSLTLNTTTYLWEAPVDMPDTPSYWDEENQQWIAMDSA